MRDEPRGKWTGSIDRTLKSRKNRAVPPLGVLLALALSFTPSFPLPLFASSPPLWSDERARQRAYDVLIRRRCRCMAMGPLRSECPHSPTLCSYSVGLATCTPSSSRSQAQLTRRQVLKFEISKDRTSGNRMLECSGAEDYDGLGIGSEGRWQRKRRFGWPTILRPSGSGGMVNLA